MDITFCFFVTLEAYETPCGKPRIVCGVASFSKKVILFGSEGNVKIFTSEYAFNTDDPQDRSASNLPKAVVETADHNLEGRRAVPSLSSLKTAFGGTYRR